MDPIMQMSEIERLVERSRVIICLGSGGVGKTTSSVTLALIGAKLGKKVGLLSIDPAKRLADALGISLGSELKKVEFGDHHKLPGEVYAAMLDQKAVFDEMVDRFSRTSEVKQRIYENSIYKQVSTNLGGPLEYMALAKLQKMTDDPSFDLIVLDTPPDTHALDFLMRPNVLSGFMEKGVINWLIKPFLLAQKLGAAKLLRVGGKMMSGISAITGINMLKMLSEFLVLMEDVIKGFNIAGEKVSRILREDTTNFVLVAAPHNAAVRSAENLLNELGANHYRLGGLLINRCFPRQMSESIEDWKKHSKELDPYEPGFNMLDAQRSSALALIDKLKKLKDQRFGAGVPTILVEERKQMIHSVEHILSFAAAVAGSEHI